LPHILSDEERKSAVAVREWLRLYGNPPTDRLFHAVEMRSKEFQVEIPNEAKLHLAACYKFLIANPRKDEKPERIRQGLRPDQEETLGRIARLKRMEIPKTARRSEEGCDDFIRSCLTPEDGRRIDNFLEETVIAPGEHDDALWFRVWALHQAILFEGDPMPFVWDAIDRLLIAGSDPDELTDRFARYDISRNAIYQRCVDLEEEGRRLI
jgi:hypothetical protein